MIRFVKVLLATGSLAFIFLTQACTPSYPTSTLNPHIEKNGASTQYSFFGSAQIQYPMLKDASINSDTGQGSGNTSDLSNETGFVFDF